MSGFNAQEYASDAPLSGEFLLGYHVQRAAYRANDVQSSDDESNEQEYIQ
jgi:hypothetical protein